MDDDCKEYRRNKPQQKFYKPGSGPLRRSSYGIDGKLNHYGSQNSVNGDILSDTLNEQFIQRLKKPEQQLYVPRSGDSCSDVDRQTKTYMRSDNSSQYNNRRMSSRQEKTGVSGGTGSYSRGVSRRDRSYGENQHKDGKNNDINYNRQYRQASETRSISPTHCFQEKNAGERNRDSRSMEATAGRHLPASGGKPPSGRRNSAGYSSDSSRSKFMANLDNIPPRFRKKMLEQSVHHSFDSVDQIHKDHKNNSVQPNYNQSQFYNSSLNWSQTLPSRGRGRLRDAEGFDKEKFLNSYFLKNDDVQHSRRSTPSSSYVNLYEPNAIDNKSEKIDLMTSSVESQNDFYSKPPENGHLNNDDSYNHLNSEDATELENQSETISQITTSLLDMTNLDWTEEVEKNIKLDDIVDISDASTSFSHNVKPAVSQENKPADARESKRNGRSRRRDRRSTSRSQKTTEKKPERNRKDSNASIQHEPERNRKDSNVSIQHEAIFTNLKQRDRERRDSHRSNRSSTIGNSRDDLDRWRSLRSYSREQSADGRIVSQCNSRDTSANRAMSPRDGDGFRVPSAVPKSSSNNQKRSNGSWANSGHAPSAEPGRHSPMPSVTSMSV